MSNKDAFNVVGLVVQTAPGKREAVKAALAAMDGVEIHAETEDGRIVVTAMDSDTQLAIDHMAAMNRTPGIVSTMIAYHQIEHPAAEAVAAPCGCSSDSDHSCLSEKRA